MILMSGSCACEVKSRSTGTEFVFSLSQSKEGYGFNEHCVTYYCMSRNAETFPCRNLL